MSFRKTAFAFIVAAAAAPVAFADTGSTWIGGEAGFADHAVTGERTRAAVRQELRAFRDHPAYLDGTVFIQGEAGYVSANQGASADRQPGAPHTHTMGNTGTAATMNAAPMSDAQRRNLREQYVN